MIFVYEIIVKLFPYFAEICGSMQCNHGAACKLTKDDSGGFLYDCDCSVIGDSSRLPVTLGCKIANNHHFYDNKIAAKTASCATKSFLTFTDSCNSKFAYFFKMKH